MNSPKHDYGKVLRERPELLVELAEYACGLDDTKAIVEKVRAAARRTRAELVEELATRLGSSAHCPSDGSAITFNLRNRDGRELLYLIVEISKTKGAVGTDVSQPAPGKPSVMTPEPTAPTDPDPAEHRCGCAESERLRRALRHVIGAMRDWATITEAALR